jgi:hypothetical protein
MLQLPQLMEDQRFRADSRDVRIRRHSFEGAQTIESDSDFVCWWFSDCFGSALCKIG